ncbi:MAG TPA: MaoC family dehydratase [Candidatus Binatia bacterium]|nr:MaoC family dehydratase [Candidatus Binatia bacterium]
MASKAEKAVESFKRLVGKPEQPGEWLQITQERINQFADCTMDHQFIHVDPEKSAQLSPYKVTIAHGFLTLSMLTHLTTTVKAEATDAYDGVVMGVNYGFDKVRFVNAVKVNSRIRVHRKLVDVQLKGTNNVQLTHECTIEIEGEAKPACIANWLTMLVYG